MIQVRVKYFLKFRDVTGKVGEIIELKDKATLQDLISTLRKKYGDTFARELTNPSGDEVSGDALIIVNDNIAKNMSTKLNNGDEVIFTYVPFGG